MKVIFSFSQFKFDLWLIEQLQITPPPGPTLEELRSRWLALPGHVGILSRDMLTTHRQAIKDFMGIVISAPDRMHYRIMNPEALALDSLANDLLKSLQNYSFLQEYKDLGKLIQPEQIETGSRYLRLIGQALRNKQKLSITYQKFTDEEPYDAIVHPYCLKADKGRWYILAYKEGSECQEPAQCFALDRTLRLTLLPETFVPNRRIKVSTYFRDCFGVWRDYEHSAHFAPSSQPERDSLQGRRLCLFPLPHFPLSRLHSRTKKMGRRSEDRGMKNNLQKIFVTIKLNIT